MIVAMGIPTTTDSSLYLLRLPHLLPIFVVPLVCFYLILAAWLGRKILFRRVSERAS